MGVVLTYGNADSDVEVVKEKAVDLANQIQILIR
jgi:hypothetical protein